MNIDRLADDRQGLALVGEDLVATSEVVGLC